MKALTIFLVFLCSTIQIRAQEPLSRKDALRQLYQQYDGSNKTAQWACPKDNQTDDPCWNGENATVSITPVLTAEVIEDGAEKTYLVASARPSSYTCHYCGPAIGVAIFAWKSDKWVLESKNSAVEFYGSFGNPGDVSLVAVGPHRYGILLSADFGGQGSYESTKALLLPLSDRIVTVWNLKDRSEDMGDDFDAHVLRSNRLRYHAISGINFFWTAGTEGDLSNQYYSLSVISHKTSRRFRSHWEKQEYWEDVYKFDGGKYIRVSHEQVTRVSHLAKYRRAVKVSKQSSMSAMFRP